MGLADLTKPLNDLPNVLSGKIPGIGGSLTSYGIDTGFHGTLPGVLEDKLYKFKSKALSHVPWLNIAIGFDNPKWPLGKEFQRRAANANATDKLGDLISPTEPGSEAADNMWGNIASKVTNSSDFARPSLYTVTVNSPQGTIKQQTSLAMQHGLLPGFELRSISTRNGKTLLEKLPNDVIYEPITLTFQLSADHSERDEFIAWMDSMFDKSTNTFDYQDNYKGTVIITTTDRQRNVTSVQRLVDAFPYLIGPVELGYDMFDAVITFDVTFAYRYWIQDK